MGVRFMFRSHQLPMISFESGIGLRFTCQNTNLKPLQGRNLTQRE